MKKPEVVGKLYHIMLYRIRLAWAGFELTTLVVIGSDCTGSCKFNSHMITTTTVRPIVKFYILFQTVRGNMLKRSAMQSFKIELLINNCYELTYGDILIDWLIDWLALNETFSSISAISWRKQVLYNKFYNYSTIWYKLDLCIKNDKRKIRDKNIVYKSVV